MKRPMSAMDIMIFWEEKNFLNLMKFQNIKRFLNAGKKAVMEKWTCIRPSGNRVMCFSIMLASR